MMASIMGPNLHSTVLIYGQGANYFPDNTAVSGVWHHAEKAAGGTAEIETVGHLAGGLLTILGYGGEPDHTVVIRPGAHVPECTDCIEYPSDAVDVGGVVLVSNADEEGHRFVTESPGAASTGHLGPGESVQLPFNREGNASYGCVYHPWLEFVVETTGLYEPDMVEGVLVLEMPAFAGESAHVGIFHAGGAHTAHVIFIQNGQVVEAGAAPLVEGYGVYTADAWGWNVGEVTVSVSAGVDHTTGIIGVRPPPGAAERLGYVTGYKGADGILINGMAARPAGVIPLDAAADATRQVCVVGQEALFRGDAGLAVRGQHYLEGTVWCGGVNLGVYLLESGLAMADVVECSVAQAEWLAPYCSYDVWSNHTEPPNHTESLNDTEPPNHTESLNDTEPPNHTESLNDTEPPNHTRSPSDAEMRDDTGQSGDAEWLHISEHSDEPPGKCPPDGTCQPGADTMEDTEYPMLSIDDLPPIPDNVAEPDMQMCDHYTDTACPCPDGWVRNGEWCDPDWPDTIDDLGKTVGDAAKDADAAAGDVRAGVVDALSGFFEWIYEGMAAVGNFVINLGRGSVA